MVGHPARNPSLTTVDDTVPLLLLAMGCTLTDSSVLFPSPSSCPCSSLLDLIGGELMEVNALKFGAALFAVVAVVASPNVERHVAEKTPGKRSCDLAGSTTDSGCSQRAKRPPVVSSEALTKSCKNCRSLPLTLQSRNTN